MEGVFRGRFRGGYVSGDVIYFGVRLGDFEDLKVIICGIRDIFFMLVIIYFFVVL